MKRMRGTQKKEEAELQMWTLKKSAAVFHQAELLKDIIQGNGPSLERAAHITRNNTASLLSLQDLFDEAKQSKRQLPITTIFFCI